VRLSGGGLIRDLRPDDERAVREAAEVLLAAMHGHTPAWPDLASALDEVRESLEPGRISLVAEEMGRVVGWIGGIPSYDGNVMEIHPLAVAPEAQGRGIGRTLVAALEDRARAAGAHTIWLGTDDEDGRTSLAGRDLFPWPLAALAALEDRGSHPFGFYLRCGYVPVGVLPDANGPGKPDIFLSKSLHPVVLPAEPGPRFALAADLPAIQALDRSAAEPGHLVWQAISDQRCAVEWQEGTLAGVVVWTAGFFRQGFVERLHVAPEHRRQGVGGRLLAFAERYSPTPTLWTSTNRSNVPMQALLAKRGWTFAGKLSGLDPGGPQRVYRKLVR
jgi:aminoglycoside 6'-N-acetyltransferase I